MDTEELVDSGTIFELVPVFRRRAPRDSYAWAWRSAVSLTMLLMEKQRIGIPAGPRQIEDPEDKYAHILRAFSDLTSPVEVPIQARDRAREDVTSWRSVDPITVRRCHADLLTNKDFCDWLDEEVEHVWPIYGARAHGLFDLDFVSPITDVCGIPTDRLVYLHSKTTNKHEREKYRRGGGEPGEFADIKTAYVIAALLRGVFHDRSAFHAALGVMHHPLRQAVFTHGDIQVEEPVAARIVANIIVADAFTTRSFLGRVGRWAKNIETIREAGGPLPAEKRSNRATDVAVEFVRRVDIGTSGSLLDFAIEYGLGGIAGSIVGYTFGPWQGLTVGSAVTKAVKDLGVSRAIHLKNDTLRLRELAKKGPGRLLDRNVR